MNYPNHYTADDFKGNAKPLPIKYEINRKINTLKDFKFITKKLKNEAAVRAWLATFKTEEEMTRALRPVMRFEKSLDEVMNA